MNDETRLEQREVRPKTRRGLVWVPLLSIVSWAVIFALVVGFRRLMSD